MALSARKVVIGYKLTSDWQRTWLDRLSIQSNLSLQLYIKSNTFDSQMLVNSAKLILLLIDRRVLVILF